MSVFRFSIDSKIRGYHVYQTIWSNPCIGEELNCKREPGNSHDPHVVAMTKVISGVSTVVGHVPIDISPICSNLEQGGREIPCKLDLSIESEKEAKKTRKRLEATLSIVVAMGTLSIRDTIDPATEDQAVEIQDKFTTDNQVVEVQDRATEDQIVVHSRAELTLVVDLSLDLSGQATEHDVSPQKKRLMLMDSEHIIMEEELTDTEINLAQ